MVITTYVRKFFHFWTSELISRLVVGILFFCIFQITLTLTPLTIISFYECCRQKTKLSISKISKEQNYLIFWWIYLFMFFIWKHYLLIFLSTEFQRAIIKDIRERSFNSAVYQKTMCLRECRTSNWTDWKCHAKNNNS